MTQLILDAYQPENFKTKATEVIQLLFNHLQSSINGENKVAIPWKDPAEEYKFWKEYKFENNNFSKLYQDFIKHSTQLHNPKCMGHQVAPPLPDTMVVDMISLFMNNGMAIYEMGSGASAIERIVIEKINKELGYDNHSGGFLTSGGTLANLTALLTARAVKKPEVWNNGYSERLAIMVSEKAHYCVDRAAKIMGLGEEGVIKIPVNENYSIDTTLLHKIFEDAKNKGINIFAIVGSACNTATGSYDDLEAIAQFAKEKEVWFHIDGAHGGPAIFSKKYKHLVKGIEKSDSVVIDCHKMMMATTLCSAVLYKEKSSMYRTFQQEASYLLEDKEDNWYDYGQFTMECTKLMMCLKVFTVIEMYGFQLFEDIVTTLYDKAKSFANILNNREEFQLAIEPTSNIICYRYFDKNLSNKELDELNKNIRRKILEKGEFYIVQVNLDGILYLRSTIMNVFSDDNTFQSLLDEIIRVKRILD